MQATDSAAMVVAIDGPSGSGKSTVARGVALRLGFGYLDTGAMYRAATWLVLDAGLPLTDLANESDRVGELLAKAQLRISTEPAQRGVEIAGHDVTDVIRGPEVTAAVSAVAELPAVRAGLSGQQRDLAAAAIASHGGIVVEGRDIGTVIFPSARLKIWLTASAEARGRRRAAEHSAAEHSDAEHSDAEHSDAEHPGPSAADGSVGSVDSVVEQLARRDDLDSSRPISPLLRAQDAHVLDTTALSADQVVDAVLALWHPLELPSEAPGGDRADTGTTGAAR